MKQMKKEVQQKPKSQKIIKQSTIEKQAPAPVVPLSGKVQPVQM